MYSMAPGAGSKRAAGAQGFAGHGGGKRRAVDQSLEEDVVPESRQYMELLTFEKHLDSLMARKRGEYLTAQRNPQKNTKRPLRVFLSCTAKMDEEGRLRWTMRVDGKIQVDGLQKKHKKQFSNFLDRMFVEFLADSPGGGAVGSSPAVAESAEWQRSPSVEESDGFEIVRTAEGLTGPVQARVLLYLQHEPSQHRLAPELAGMIGLFQGTRHEVIRAIWEYVTVNKLQDAENPEIINCDKYMQQCFPGETQLNFTEIPVKLNQLFLPLQPVELIYTIPMVGGQPAREIYDVWVEVDDGEHEQIDLQAHKDLEPAIDTKRDEIARLKAEIGEARQKREFMLMFAKDPKEFLVAWLGSQARETRDEGAKGALTEEQRAANFYNTPYSKEAVYRYYGEMLKKRHEELK